MVKSEHITYHAHKITKEERAKKFDQKPCIIWFTGLSGSGKSTLSQALAEELFKRSSPSYVLDGDNIRFGLNKNLGFSPEDREENIRRIGEVAKLFVDSGLIVLTAFISPYAKDRDAIRALVDEGEFIEILVDCPIEICEQRDVKGLYKKARAGEIKGFTGIDDPYEAPQNPEITVNTGKDSIEDCVNKIIEYLENKKVIKNE